MNKIKIFLCISLFLIVLNINAFANENGYIVKFKDGFKPDDSAFEEANSEIGLYKIENKDILEKYEHKIEYVEENATLEFIDDFNGVELLSLPEDEFYPEQWQVQAVNADYIWDFETYGNEVNVSVIDTGCNLHDDIKDNVKGGFDYIRNGSPFEDNNGHGTHVAGIIASAHNDFGISGVAPKVNIYALKCVESGYVTTVDMLAKAIKDAVDVYDSKVISMSIGTPAHFNAIYDSVRYAYDKGAVIVAAVGNITSSGYDYYFPAGYDEVIGVGSVGIYNNVSSFSLKNESVFVVAPGEKVKSLKGTNEYVYKSGTSQATPIVSGIVALMMSADNTLNTEHIKYIIKNTSTDLGESGYDYTYGYGLINAKAMFNMLLGTMPYYVSPINDGQVLLHNNTKGPAQFKGIFAEYDSKKRYVRSDITDVLVMSGKKVKISSDIKENSKFFLWYSLGKPYPYAKVREN